jgi:UDP-GlcNAc:undecaprenyl-phosphate/decaprenyl-phosphate GlcNAc-1-phosphate transferase
MMYRIGIETLLVAGAVSWILTPAVIRLARAIGAVDQPGPRKIHSRPVPRMGGLAVFLGFFAGVAFAAFRAGYFDVLPELRLGYWLTLAVAATGMFLLGLADDLFGVPFQWKFAFQAAAAILVWAGGFRIEILSRPFGNTPLDLGMLSLPLTTLWIVGITNAMNLIDGLDGLAAGTALITSVAVAVVAFNAGQPGIVGLSVALVGSLAGFLRFNFNPARIFLGDCGSMFLGFVLAVASIHGSQKAPTAVAVLAPLLVLGLPILDTGMAILRRIYNLGAESQKMDSGLSLRYVVRNSRRIFQPDRRHLHHQLLDLGLSHRGAVLVLYGAVGTFGLAAMTIVLLRSLWLTILLLAALTLSVGVLTTAFLLRAHLKQAKDDPPRAQTPAGIPLGSAGRPGATGPR